MRILFTFTGGRGHAEPLVPIAQAAKYAGHTVAFAGRPSILPILEAMGFKVFATEQAREAPAKRIPLREIDIERERREFREGFAERIARDRAPRVLALCAEWKPDLVVSEESDFSGMVVAERLGLPYASILLLAAGSFIQPDVVAEPLNALRSALRLAHDPTLAMLSRYLVLSPFPPSLRDPGFPLPDTAHSFRLGPPPPARAASDGAPAWLAQLDEAPTVYFTLGTVFNMESGDLFARVLAGLRDLPINVVATVGSEIDPDELGPQPRHVHVERYIPQSLVLPRCSAVVLHGGSGSVLGALTHGLPMVLLPMGADQPMNAARCQELGVGRVLDALRATPETIRASVSSVLTDTGYRAAAERIGDEIAGLPGPDYAVALLERLGGEGRPLTFPEQVRRSS
jgi:UDP:flavonoid glycosyltransferase YjiC (YdhE family)